MRLYPITFTDDEKEALDLIWRLHRTPDDIRLWRWVLSIKLPIMAALRLKRAVVGAPPELTKFGRDVLRGWRTCYDCHQEITELLHDCPARRRPHPYRVVSR